MGRLGFVLLCCGLALAGLSSATAASGNVPTTQTLKPKGLGLSFSMPSDWAGANGGPSGLRYEVIAPGRVENLSIYTVKTAAPLSALATQLVAFTRKQFAGYKGLKVANSSTTLGLSTPAVEIKVGYYGLWSDTATAGEIHQDIFLIIRAGVLIEFDYGGVDPWASKDAPVIAASVKSIRFALIA